MKGSCFVMFNSQNILDLAVNGLEAGVIRSQRLGGTSLQEKNIKRLTPGMGAFNLTHHGHLDNNNWFENNLTSHKASNTRVTRQKHWIRSLVY